MENLLALADETMLMITISNVNRPYGKGKKKNHFNYEVVKLFFPR